MPRMTTGRKEILEVLVKYERLTRGQITVEVGSDNQSMQNKWRPLLDLGWVEVALIRQETKHGPASELLRITDVGRRALADSEPKPGIRVEVDDQRAMAERVLVEGASLVGYEPSQLLNLQRRQKKEMQARDVLIWVGKQRGVTYQVLAEVFGFVSDATALRASTRIEKKLEQQDPDVVGLCAKVADQFK